MGDRLLTLLFAWEPHMEPSFLWLSRQLPVRQGLLPLLPLAWEASDLEATDLFGETDLLDRTAGDLLDGHLLYVYRRSDEPGEWRARHERAPETWTRYRIARHRPVERHIDLVEHAYGEGWPDDLSAIAAAAHTDSGGTYLLGEGRLWTLDGAGPPQPCKPTVSIGGGGLGEVTGLCAVDETLYVAAGGRVHALRADTLRPLACSYLPGVQLFNAFPVRHPVVSADGFALLVGERGEVALCPPDGGRPHLLRLRHRGREVRPRRVWPVGRGRLIVDDADRAGGGLRAYDTASGREIPLPPWLPRSPTDGTPPEFVTLSHDRLASRDPERGRIEVGDWSGRHFSFAFRPEHDDLVPGGMIARGAALLLLGRGAYMVAAEGEGAERASDEGDHRLEEVS